ncbi:hypothetical protein KVMX100_140486 [Klebsiella variicola]|nr:hypothetical protein KVMX100_140486 [Klebsiella variicola]
MNYFMNIISAVLSLKKIISQWLTGKGLRQRKKQQERA